MRKLFVILFLLASSTVFAHQGMSPMGKIVPYDERQYLFGINRNDPEHGIINCCLMNGNGDCQLYPEEGVQTVPGGYLLSDGEFIPEHETTVSPDENFYRVDIRTRLRTASSLLREDIKMKMLTTLAVISMFLASTFSYAQDVPQTTPCVELGRLPQEMTNAGMMVARLPDSVAIEKALEAYNQSPPFIVAPIDSLLMGLSEDGAVIMFLSGTQSCGVLTFDREHFEKFLDGISGVRA